MLMPNADERDGYVVYSCGALRHGDALVIPYAVSDSHSTIAVVAITELLAKLKAHPAVVEEVVTVTSARSLSTHP